MESNILIWNESVGFIKINEGSGDNLLPEDELEGYVDYIMVDFIEYDGYDFTETDGAQVMLRQLYQEKFEHVDDVVQYLIDGGWIPGVEYTYLYMK